MRRLIESNAKSCPHPLPYASTLAARNWTGILGPAAAFDSESIGNLRASAKASGSSQLCFDEESLRDVGFPEALARDVEELDRRLHKQKEEE